MRDYITADERLGISHHHRMFNDLLAIVGWFVFVFMVTCELLKR